MLYLVISSRRPLVYISKTEFIKGVDIAVSDVLILSLYINSDNDLYIRKYLIHLKHRQWSNCFV